MLDKKIKTGSRNAGVNKNLPTPPKHTHTHTAETVRVIAWQGTEQPIRGSNHLWVDHPHWVGSSQGDGPKGKSNTPPSVEAPHEEALELKIKQNEKKKTQP